MAGARGAAFLTSGSCQRARRRRRRPSSAPSTWHCGMAGTSRRAFSTHIQPSPRARVTRTLLSPPMTPNRGAAPMSVDHDLTDIHAPLSQDADALVWDGEREALTGITLFMEALGLSPADDPHLAETPRRVAHMYRHELLRQQDFAFTTFRAETTGMIVQRDIQFVSICSHHLIPFIGKAHVAYI